MNLDLISLIFSLTFVTDSVHYHVIEGRNTALVPLFVIHTSPLDHNYLLQSIPDGFSPTQSIYFIDLPSHGQSFDIEDRDLAFRILSDHLDELRKQLGFEKIHVLGHGIGGFVSQYYAAYHNKHINSLIISNSSPNHNYREEMAWNIRKNYSNADKQALANYEGRTDEESLIFKFRKSLTYHFNPPSGDKADLILNSVSRFASEAYVIISNFIIPLYDIRQYNQRLKVPVMIISGKFDVWPKLIIDMYRTDIPRAYFVEFESGHFPMLDKPEEYWQSIDSWLTKTVKNLNK